MIVNRLPGQPGEYPHPELKWFTLESPHFIVYYHEGAERTANTLLKIGEEIYAPITQIYQYEPDTRIRIVVMDTDDYSNGAAYYYDNKILIWATALDWDLRGSHNWLRNVLTHEFSHLVQLGAARKMSRRVPAFYLQWLNYEDERRPDVLYGFPNVIMSYPIAMTQVPPWFAEGCAQSQFPGFGYDSFDSHRDMILRTRTLTGTLLTLDEMGAFGKNTIGNESVYNQGYSLVQFIARKYGTQAPQKISQKMSNPANFSFDRALQKAIGSSETALYSAWKDSLEKYYQNATALITDHQVQGEKIETGGYGNFYPQFLSEDEIVYLSNQGNDYLSMTGLYKMNLKSGEITKLTGSADSRPSISPDRRWVVYSKQKGVHKGSHFQDIFVYDLKEKQEHRLTLGARAFSPAFSPDGKMIVFAVNQAGTMNLALSQLPDLSARKLPPIKDWKFITHFQNGEQVYNPIFTPDGKSVIFAYAYEGPRDIALVNIADGEIKWLRKAPCDERNPSLSPDGTKLLYSSDRTGIYNLYAYDLSTAEDTLLTNVLGSAFMGALSPEGKLIYSGYDQNGFYLFQITAPSALNSDYSTYIQNYPESLPRPQFEDRDLPSSQADRYRPAFGPLFYLPRLTYDVRSFKPGLYVYNSDFLDWFSFIGGFSFNGLTEEPRVFQSVTRLNPQYLGDYDLFAVLEYRNIKPNIFLEAYNIVRKSHQEFEDDFVILREIPSPSGELIPVYALYTIDYRFSLSEVDAGLRLRLNDADLLELRAITSQYNAKLRFDDGSAFSYTYFKGKSLSLKWERDYRPLSINSDIHPQKGGKIITELARENNDFIEGFTVESGLLQEVFTPYNYNRYSLQWEHYLKSPLNPAHALTLRMNGGMIDRKDLDDFFYLYAGGLPGLKGYSYYALGGTRKFIGTLTYRLPLFEHINRRFLHSYVHNLYLGLFCDFGDAWVNEVDLSQWKKDIGINVRTQLTSFYTYPTAISFDAAYGLDRFTVSVPDFSGTYGREWRFYLTILFSFNLFLGGFE